MINPQEMAELQKSSFNFFGMTLKLHDLIQQRNPLYRVRYLPPGNKL